MPRGKVNVNAALDNLDEAGDAASATTSKMKAQTRQLENANKNMDMVGATLNKTDKLTSELENEEEPGFFAGWFGNPTKEELDEKRALKREAEELEVAASEAKQYDGEKPLKEGWLTKRGPLYGFPWERRWCCLFPTLLTYYDDDKKTQKKGDIVLSAFSKVHVFGKGRPPGDGVRHRPEKEFGFMLDPDSQGGNDRFFHYFDGEDKRNMKHWLKHLDHCAKVLMNEHLANCAEDAGLALVESKVDGLLDQAHEMGDEARHQGELISSLDSKVEDASENLESQTRRLKKL